MVWSLREGFLVMLQGFDLPTPYMGVILQNLLIKCVNSIKTVSKLLN